MINKLICTIWVCEDCMLHEANGECGSCHDDNGHDVEPWAKLGDDERVTMGLSYDEHTCDDPRSGECECEINTFSTSQCEGCGSWLHGERHAFALWARA